METLIKQLQYLEQCNKNLLSMAEANKDKDLINFYKGELQGLKTAILFAKNRMEKESK